MPPTNSHPTCFHPSRRIAATVEFKEKVRTWKDRCTTEQMEVSPPRATTEVFTEESGGDTEDEEQRNDADDNTHRISSPSSSDGTKIPGTNPSSTMSPGLDAQLNFDSERITIDPNFDTFGSFLGSVLSASEMIDERDGKTKTMPSDEGVGAMSMDPMLVDKSMDSLEKDMEQRSPNYLSDDDAVIMGAVQDEMAVLEVAKWKYEGDDHKYLDKEQEVQRMSAVYHDVFGYGALVDTRKSMGMLYISFDKMPVDGGLNPRAVTKGHVRASHGDSRDATPPSTPIGKTILKRTKPATDDPVAREETELINSVKVGVTLKFARGPNDLYIGIVGALTHRGYSDTGVPLVDAIVSGFQPRSDFVRLDLYDSGFPYTVVPPGALGKMEHIASFDNLYSRDTFEIKTLGGDVKIDPAHIIAVMPTGKNLNSQIMATAGASIVAKCVSGLVDLAKPYICWEAHLPSSQTIQISTGDILGIFAGDELIDCMIVLDMIVPINAKGKTLKSMLITKDTVVRGFRVALRGRNHQKKTFDVMSPKNADKVLKSGEEPLFSIKLFNNVRTIRALSLRCPPSRKGLASLELKALIGEPSVAKIEGHFTDSSDYKPFREANFFDGPRGELVVRSPSPSTLLLPSYTYTHTHQRRVPSTSGRDADVSVRSCEESWPASPPLPLIPGGSPVED